MKNNIEDIDAKLRETIDDKLKGVKLPSIDDFVNNKDNMQLTEALESMKKIRAKSEQSSFNKKPKPI
jgi:hypothetical protein